MEGSASDLVALLADGSYRDGLSVLEKVFSVSKDKTLTRDEVSKATGAPKAGVVHGFVKAISEGNAGEALKTVRGAAADGLDMNLYLSLVLDYIRQILLTRYAPELKASLVLELGAETFAEVESLARATGSKLSHQTLKSLLAAAARARYAPVPSLPLELSVFELFPDEIAK